MEGNGWHIAFKIPTALLSCFLLLRWMSVALVHNAVNGIKLLCLWLIVWKTEFLLKLQQLDLNNDVLKPGTWSLGLVVFKHSNWNSSQSAEWHTCGDSKSRIFWWFYSYGIASYTSSFERVLQTLKIIYNIISKSEFKGGYTFKLFTLLHLFLLDSHWTPGILLDWTRTRQISCWLITIQILYPSPSGVLVNSYWNEPKSQGIADS